MKKTLIAFAALSAIAGMAQAQSTVTIYGLLDGNLQNYKTSVAGAGTQAGTIQNLSQARIESAGFNGSRWGIRLSEDLGGGLSVVGNLESGFSIDTGASGQGALFGRRANVGMSGGFGTVTIGRNSSSYDDVSGDHAMMAQSIFDPSNVNNAVSIANARTELTAARTLLAIGGGTAANAIAYNTAALPFLNHDGRTWLGYSTRFNNSIKYNTPNFSGFSGSFMYALGEDNTTAVGASRTISANVKYANGPLVVSGGYQSEGGTRTAATATTGSTSPSIDNTLISVSYDLGVAKIGAGYNIAKYRDLLPGVSLDAQKEYNISVAVPLGATTVSAGYARSKGNDFGVSTGFGVQATYALSKRTTLYGGALSSKAYSDIQRVINQFSPASTVGNTTMYAVGVRHRF